MVIGIQKILQTWCVKQKMHEGEVNVGTQNLSDGGGSDPGLVVSGKMHQTQIIKIAGSCPTPLQN